MAFDRNESLNLELARIRATVITQLSNVSSLSPDDCRETYLFDNEHFCGVRWTLGSTRAVWRIGTDTIAYDLNGQTIDPSKYQPTPLRRAA